MSMMLYQFIVLNAQSIRNVLRYSVIIFEIRHLVKIVQFTIVYFYQIYFILALLDVIQF